LLIIFAIVGNTHTQTQCDQHTYCGKYTQCGQHAQLSKMSG